MTPILKVNLLDEREEASRSYAIVAVRSALPGELLADLHNECVTVAGSRISGLNVIVKSCDYSCRSDHTHDANGCTEEELGCGPLGCSWTPEELAMPGRSVDHDAGAPPDGRCLVHGLTECPATCPGPNKLHG